MVQRYEQKRRLQWYKRGAAYSIAVKGGEGWVKGQVHPSPSEPPVFIGISGQKVKGEGCFLNPSVTFFFLVVIEYNVSRCNEMCLSMAKYCSSKGNVLPWKGTV